MIFCDRKEIYSRLFIATFMDMIFVAMITLRIEILKSILEVVVHLDTVFSCHYSLTFGHQLIRQIHPLLLAVETTFLGLVF